MGAQGSGRDIKGHNNSQSQNNLITGIVGSLRYMFEINRRLYINDISI